MATLLPPLTGSNRVLTATLQNCGVTREYDVVVLGATSLTAREVCRYLAVRGAEVSMTWAGAGRSVERVRAALDQVGCAQAGVVQADVSDPASLAALAARTRVVLNLVGPYAPTAGAVVEACITAETHYLDLTGEMTFVRDLSDRLDASAQDAGVKVVQPCGFESLPFDLLVGLVLDRADSDVTSVDVEFVIEQLPRGLRPTDAVSGGTIQSLAGLVGEDDASRTFDPALLVRDIERAEQVRRVSPLRLRPRIGLTGGALAPLVPAPTINPPVIHRSAELLDLPVLRYREGARVLDGAATLPIGVPVAVGASAAFTSVRLAAKAPAPLRRVLASTLTRTLPGAGFGPAEKRIEQWRWRLVARATTDAGESIEVGVTGSGHPGYLTTATMFAEAGLLVAGNQSLPERAGFLTPLAALGTANVNRFARAGLHFAAVDSDIGLNQ